jgi:hypothetical protein
MLHPGPPSLASLESVCTRQRQLTPPATLPSRLGYPPAEDYRLPGPVPQSNRLMVALRARKEE